MDLGDGLGELRPSSGSNPLKSTNEISAIRMAGISAVVAGLIYFSVAAIFGFNHLTGDASGANLYKLPGLLLLVQLVAAVALILGGVNLLRTGVGGRRIIVFGGTAILAMSVVGALSMALYQNSVEKSPAMTPGTSADFSLGSTLLYALPALLTLLVLFKGTSNR